MIKSTAAFAATPEMNELAIKEGLAYGVLAPFIRMITSSDILIGRRHRSNTP